MKRILALGLSLALLAWHSPGQQKNNNGPDLFQQPAKQAIKHIDPKKKPALGTSLADILRAKPSPSSCRKGNPVAVLSSAPARLEEESFTSKNTVRITLDVQVDWGDGSGYQLLLDADTTAYGLYIPDNGVLYPSPEAPATLYDLFEYKIPENATGNLNDYTVVGPGESETIEIPAGFYDACITNPAYDAIYIANGSGRLDNFEFIAGSEYIFTITWNSGFDNAILSRKANIDLALVSIDEPTTSLDLGPEEKVTVLVENLGIQDIPSYNLSYSTGYGNTVTETVSEPIAAGERKLYTFEQPADLSQEAVYYSVTAFVDAQGDEQGSNDTLSKTVTHIGPVQPPYFCDFNDPADMEQWSILNPDGDIAAWYWIDGQVLIEYNMYLPLNDYIVSLCPVHLEAGQAYVSFEYNGVHPDYKESMAVFFGKSSNTEEMTLVTRLDSISTQEGKQFCNASFSIEESGDYYFAFHACSPAGMYGLILDNVAIGQGAYVATADLEITDIVLPLSGCEFSSETVLSVNVSNKGQADITSYALSYSVDNGSPVSQSFGLLPQATDTTVSFDVPMDLEAIGLHHIQVSGEIIQSAGGKEIILNNNTARDSIMNFKSLEAPFSTNFADAMQSSNWKHTGNWIWDDMTGGLTARNSNPMVSRCIHLEEGRYYRFSMIYTAGYYILETPFPEHFSIRYGLAGTDISTWKVLWEEEEAYEEAFIREDTAFLCEAEGNYSFAITSSSLLWIREIEITEVIDHDIRINSYRLPVARLIPAEQANGRFTAEIELQNRGSQASEVRLTAWLGKDSVSAMEVPSMEMNELRTVEFGFQLQDLKVDDTATLHFIASVPGHETEDSTSDHSFSRRIKVTKDVMAYDNVTDEMFVYPLNYVIGGTTEMTAGIPFTLTNTDTLTHLMFGWGAPENEEVTIAIHRWDAETESLGNLLFDTTVQAGLESGFVSYELPGLLLSPGEYMISETSTGYILMADATVNGYLYITSVTPPVYQSGIGFPAIRAVFGSSRISAAKDVAATEIIRPATEGVFSANQEIVARIANLGYEKASTSVTLWINDKLIQTKNTEINAYETSEMVFEADMSMPSSEYVLKIATGLEGDENPANDTIIKAVHSLAPVNPYEMNFEYCEDFASETFNPEWTTLDRDGGMIGGLTNFDFPLFMEACGFIVFNPDKTEPSMLAAAPEMVSPHSGERFGASVFLYIGGQNDDWLISPKLQLPAYGAKMEFHVKSLMDKYGLEQYNVLVSTTGNDPDNFVKIGETREAPVEWTLVEVDLQEYAGRSVHLAIQCVSNEVFMFMIDDIKVSMPTGNEGGNTVESQLSLYPNPAEEIIRIRSTDAKIEHISIVNAAGLPVYENAHMHQNDFQYNVSRLQAGIYFARIITDQGPAVLKFVVK